jgi:hypothetical protein
MANRRGTADRAAGGDRHNKATDGIRIPGVYEHVLREWCREEVMNPNNKYPVDCYGALAYEHEEYVAWEAEVEAVVDKLFDERVGLGEPVNAWWYWLPKNLPPPLHNLGKAGDGPRHFWVTADDLVSPPMIAGPQRPRWSTKTAPCGSGGGVVL